MKICQVCEKSEKEIRVYDVTEARFAYLQMYCVNGERMICNACLEQRRHSADAPKPQNPGGLREHAF